MSCFIVDVFGVTEIIAINGLILIYWVFIFLTRKRMQWSQQDSWRQLFLPLGSWPIGEKGRYMLSIYMFVIRILLLCDSSLKILCWYRKCEKLNFYIYFDFTPNYFYNMLWVEAFPLISHYGCLFAKHAFVNELSIKWW